MLPVLFAPVQAALGGRTIFRLTITCQAKGARDSAGSLGASHSLLLNAGEYRPIRAGAARRTS